MCQNTEFKYLRLGCIGRVVPHFEAFDEKRSIAIIFSPTQHALHHLNGGVGKMVRLIIVVGHQTCNYVVVLFDVHISGSYYYPSTYIYTFILYDITHYSSPPQIRHLSIKTLCSVALGSVYHVNEPLSPLRRITCIMYDQLNNIGPCVFDSNSDRP